MPVFGDVDEVEEHAEGSGHDRRLSVIEGRDPRVEFRFGSLLARPAIAGQRPNLLHEVQRFLPFRFPDHAAEHVSEEADVAAEKVIIDHGKPSGMGW